MGAVDIVLSLTEYLGLPTDDIQQNAFRLDAGHLARYRQAAGDGIFRLSAGLEDALDLCADLGQAMEPS